MIATRGRLPPPCLDLLVRDIEAAILSNDRTVQSELVVRSAEALTRRWSRLPPAEKPGFDRLLASLLDHVDEPARAAFARQLAPLRRAPRLTTTRLACDPSLRVAGPLLRTCPSFDEEWLLQLIGVVDEAHRAVIARRPEVSARVSETLLRSRQPLVLSALVANAGGAVPQEALAGLVPLAEASLSLMLALAGRSDLAAEDRAALADLARAQALGRLAAEGRLAEDEADALLSTVAETFAAPVDPDHLGRYSAAAAAASRLRGNRPVASSRLSGWLAVNRIEDVSATIARDTDLPIAVIVACRETPEPQGLAVVMRGLGHPWSLLKALLQPGRGIARSLDEISTAHRIHTALSLPAARSVARYAAIRAGGSAFLAAAAADAPQGPTGPNRRAR